MNAIDGGVEIWKIILVHDPRWKDHGFNGHRKYVLELLIDLEKPILLEFLLRKDADTDRAGDPVLDMAKARRASPEIRVDRKVQPLSIKGFNGWWLRFTVPLYTLRNVQTISAFKIFQRYSTLQILRLPPPLSPLSRSPVMVVVR